MLFKYRLIYCILTFLVLQSCNSDQPLFVLKSDDTAPFHNNLVYSEDFNPYTYRNFYNGGGVALGDINNDGLLDLYFTGNMVDNKMYLNKGNWTFEDVTKTTGLACADVWSSGACFVDINGDGWLDLYVCKAGKPGGENRHNELFINKGNLTFEEEAANYGLDVTGLSIQSAFFDYDRDGDLDCYLLNNSLKAIGGFDLVKDKRKIPSENGNKLFENRNNRFYDVTAEAGIYSSEIGFGLGITLSDFNLDGWPDVYISNDFFEKDYLYINNKNKTFTEQGEDYFECYPLGSMGADVADLDNDLLPDLMITEMLPSTIRRKKTKAIYDSWNKYSLAVSKGYYHQLPRNMLQKNMGASGFLEIGRKAGVEATNWSWSCLMQDFDNDGLKDIIVANGIYKDLLDRDYLAFMANDSKIKNIIDEGNDAITQLIDAMPSKAVPNFAFKNVGNFNFVNESKSWGLDMESFSNGCAYGDLDNDGDLDLVFNNVNMASTIFENTTQKLNHSFVKIKLKGKQANTKAIGAKAIVYACGQTFMNEQYPSRGFQSSVSNHIVLGLGQCQNIDSIKVIWPDGHYTLKSDVAINTTYEFIENDLVRNQAKFEVYQQKNIFKPTNTLPFTHRQLKFNQFNRERLLYKMNATDGPAIALADCNQDGQTDFFVGGGKSQLSKLFLSGADTAGISVPFSSSKRSEVVDAQFFDIDNDQDQDLYVAHGGTGFSPHAVELNDEIYLNDGNGNLEKTTTAIAFSRPIATGAVAIGDYNQDGYSDIFIGERNSNKVYGLPGEGFLFKNNGKGQMEPVKIPAFENLGIVNDAKWIDVNGDDLLDLLVVGEWMPITVFINTGDGFEAASESIGFEQSNGMWNNILVADFNQDGEVDIFVGNIGSNGALNNRHRLYVHDFDGNGSVEQILCEETEGGIYPILDMDELVSQLPILKRQFVYYKDYAALTIDQLFDKATLDACKVLHLETVESQLFFKNKNQFERQALPEELQFSSIHVAKAHDFDRDGTIDLLVGGNHYLTKPQFGRADASKAWLVKGFQQNGEFRYSKASPLNMTGQIRDFEIFNNQLLVGTNNQQIMIYTF